MFSFKINLGVLRSAAELKVSVVFIVYRDIYFSKTFYLTQMFHQSAKKDQLSLKIQRVNTLKLKRY